jgi:hypothetical protein
MPQSSSKFKHNNTFQIQTMFSKFWLQNLENYIFDGKYLFIIISTLGNKFKLVACFYSPCPKKSQ